MLRAALYLGASGVVWLAEGIIFSQFLGFRTWQVILTIAIYAGLFGVAVETFRRTMSHPTDRPAGVSSWHFLALAPMAAVIVGSFVSLPIVMLILLLGQIVPG